MKRRSLFIAVILAVQLLLIGSSAQQSNVLSQTTNINPSVNAKSQTNTVSSSIDAGRFVARIIKVYAATDGLAYYRAYVVNWSNQEIVVTDQSPTHWETNFYKEGDTISVYVRRKTVGNGQEALEFSLSPFLRRIPFRRGG
jgi:hypothetical protein